MIKKVCDGLAENEHSIHAEWWALTTCWFRWWICKHVVQRDSFCVLGYMHMIWNNLSFDWATLVRFLSNLWHRAFLTVLIQWELRWRWLVLMALVSVMLKPCIFIHESVVPLTAQCTPHLKVLFWICTLQNCCNLLGVCLVACVQSKDYGMTMR
jgi:hypothetical protein